MNNDRKNKVEFPKESNSPPPPPLSSSEYNLFSSWEERKRNSKFFFRCLDYEREAKSNLEVELKRIKNTSRRYINTRVGLKSPLFRRRGGGIISLLSGFNENVLIGQLKVKE